MSPTDNSATLTFSSCCLLPMMIDNNLKRLVLPNCLLVTPVKLLVLQLVRVGFVFMVFRWLTFLGVVDY